MSKYKDILTGLLNLLTDENGDSPYGLYEVWEGADLLDIFFEAANNGTVTGIETVVDQAEYEAYAINYLKTHGLTKSDLKIVHTDRDHDGGFDVVICIKDEYFKFQGTYDSYEGADLNINHIRRCVPKQVEITVYEFAE